MGTLNLSNGVSLSATGTAFGNSAASWSDAPPGTIIQTVSATTTTELSTSSTSYQTWFGVTWTPLQTNSHKIITVFPIRNRLSANVEINYRIFDGTNNTVRWRVYNGSSSVFYMSPTMSWYWTQSHTAGTSVTFSAQARDGGGGTGSVIWGDSGGTSTIMVQEIAQ